MRVVPRGGRNALDGITDDGALKVRLAAPLGEGAANALLIAFLATLLDMPKPVTIIAGERGRNKRVHIAAPLSTVEATIEAAITATIETKPHAA